MIKLKFKIAALCALLPLSSPAAAAEYVAFSNASGWLSQYNEGFAIDTCRCNYIVGEGPQRYSYRNWFLFKDLVTDISRASLFLYSTASYQPPQGGAVYTLRLYEGDTFGANSYTYDHLSQGSLLAQVSVPVLSASEYWEIEFSSNAIEMINAAVVAKGSVRLSGQFIADGTLFGYSGNGQPPNYLSLTALNSAGVPEPATWLTMVLGFAAVGFGMRRKQHQSVRYSF